MHWPTNLPTKSEAPCCTVRVFNTGTMWISMLCAGLLASERPELRIQCSARFLLSLHRFARLLSPALGWGPALKILLWCDGSCTCFCDAEFWCDLSASIGFTMFSDLLRAFCGSMSAPVWNRGPSTMFPERTCSKACKREVP